MRNFCAICQIDFCHICGTMNVQNEKQRRKSMKIKIIAVILVFISSFFGNTIEATAPDEKVVEASSYSQNASVESVVFTE